MNQGRKSLLKLVVFKLYSWNINKWWFTKFRAVIPSSIISLFLIITSGLILKNFQDQFKMTYSCKIFNFPIHLNIQKFPTQSPSKKPKSYITRQEEPQKRHKEQAEGTTIGNNK